MIVEHGRGDPDAGRRRPARGRLPAGAGRPRAGAPAADAVRPLASADPAAAIDPERPSAGFALVCQDVRGQYGSEGGFYSFVHEGPDGYDTVEWTAAQPWCNGAVGMVGRSYAAPASGWRPPSGRRT